MLFFYLFHFGSRLCRDEAMNLNHVSLTKYDCDQWFELSATRDRRLKTQPTDWLLDFVTKIQSVASLAFNKPFVIKVINVAAIKKKKNLNKNDKITLADSHFLLVCHDNFLSFFLLAWWHRMDPFDYHSFVLRSINKCLEEKSSINKMHLHRRNTISISMVCLYFFILQDFCEVYDMKKIYIEFWRQPNKL